MIAGHGCGLPDNDRPLRAARRKGQRVGSEEAIAGGVWLAEICR